MCRAYFYNPAKSLKNGNVIRKTKKVPVWRFEIHQPGL